jgi:hypothetical protein
VVAGLNYRLTLALLVGEDNICLGGIDGATIYKPLPHTGMGLRVKSWGRELGCDDVSALIIRRWWGMKDEVRQDNNYMLQ